VRFKLPRTRFTHYPCSLPPCTIFFGSRAPTELIEGLLENFLADIGISPVEFATVLETASAEDASPDVDAALTSVASDDAAALMPPICTVPHSLRTTHGAQADRPCFAVISHMSRIRTLTLVGVSTGLGNSQRALA
jgi:hypothetical protein